jgi:hypothetical protein
MPCNTSSASRQIVKYANLNVQNGDGSYGTLTNYAHSESGGNESGACFDPASDLLLYANFNSGSSVIYAVQIVSGAPSARIPLTTAGTPPATVSKSAAIAWSSRRQSIIYYSTTSPSFGGSDGRALVYELLKPSRPTQDPWTWNLLTNITLNAVSPALPYVDNGIYSKFQIAAYTDGELGVLATRADQPAYVFRIP